MKILKITLTTFGIIAVAGAVAYAAYCYKNDGDLNKTISRARKSFLGIKPIGELPPNNY